MLFVREDVPAKFIASETPPVEGIYVEVKLRKQNLLISCSYNPNKSMICQHIFFLNWDSLHARLNSHYELQEKKSTKKITGYRKSV